MKSGMYFSVDTNYKISESRKYENNKTKCRYITIVIGCNLDIIL